MSTTGIRRAFDLARVIRFTFTAFTQTARLLLPLALLVIALPIALLGMLSVAVAYNSGGNPDGALLGPFNRLIETVLQLAVQAAVIQTVIVHGEGRQPKLDDGLGAARHLLPLFGIQIIASIGIIFGLLLLVVPGLILAAAWCVAAPARVAEGRGVFDSLSRSFDLTRGARLSVLGLLIGGLILMIVIFVAISAAATALITAIWPTGLAYAQAIVDPTAGAVMGVFQAVGLAAIYLELRRIKEGAAPETVAAVFD